MIKIVDVGSIVMWKGLKKFAITFQSSPLNLLVQLELYFVEMMFRRSSTKIYSFQFEQTKNGILISYWPIYKKHLLLWNYRASWKRTLQEWCLEGPLQQITISYWSNTSNSCFWLANFQNKNIFWNHFVIRAKFWLKCRKAIQLLFLCYKCKVG